MSALAACVEFIHTATLLHDDVVDESELRRGLATRQRALGQQAQRAGRRFPVQPRLPADGRGRLARRCWRILSRGLGRSSPRARCMQLVTTERHRRPREAAVPRRHPRARPPTLFAAAMPHRRGGGGPAEGARRRRLQSYGRNLGIAFQLIDDVARLLGRSRQRSARPSATISARARSRCRSSSPSRRGDEAEQGLLAAHAGGPGPGDRTTSAERSP